MFNKRKRRFKVSYSCKYEIGFGGIVIPEIPTISNQTEYESFQGKMRVSFSVCTAMFGIYWIDFIDISVVYDKVYRQRFLLVLFFVFLSGIFMVCIY